MLWAILGGSLAVNFEFQARRGLSWAENWWWMLGTAFLIQLSVYHLVRSDLGWLPSIVLFGGTTAVARIVLSFLALHEPPTVPNVVAATMLLSAAVVRLAWR